jgi:endo-1,4-beta-xylanase
MPRMMRNRWGTSLALSGAAIVCAAAFWSSTPAAGGAAPEGAAASPSLKQAAGPKLLIGVAVMSNQLDDPKLAPFIAREFSSLTPENEFKPENLQPRKGEFTFDAADRIAAFARGHDMKLVGHTLCWHNQTPRWMFSGDDGRPLPREQALANLRAHIDGVVKHFKGQVIGWDVVNEAIVDGGGPNDYLRDTPARKAIGDDYIAKAFEFAHAADPGAELYYNDYANENPDKRARTLRLIKDLKAKGVHIDGVGLQCHFAMKWPGAPALLDDAVKAYRDAGVKVMITELDVDVLPRRTGGAEVSARETAAGGSQDPYTNGLPPDVAKAQADFYRKVFAVARKYPGVVTRVTLWGTHDGHSWLNNWPVRGRTNHPLLWDRDLKAKPAFDAAVKALADRQVISQGRR